MKFIYLIPLIAVLTKASAQDIIYPVTGDKIPAKVVDISADKIKYKKNQDGPVYVKSFSNVLFSFNATGGYLVFSDKTPISEDEKAAFMSETPATKATDIIVDKNGGVTAVNITSVKESTITISLKGKPKVIQKSLLMFMIRKDGTHELFIDADKAADYLANAKTKIYQLTGRTIAAPAAQTAAKTAAPAAIPTTIAKTAAPSATPTTINTNAATNAELNVDPKQFEDKAIAKVKQFNEYVKTIYQASTTRDAAKTAINLAVGLFSSDTAKVEVSSINSNAKNSYKIRFYLERMQFRGKQYDHVEVTFANINYASKFTQGANGNWYATITFVQKFEGFVDGKMKYGDIVKRNLQVVLKKYDKVENGETKKMWDVFFEDMGIVETTKV